MSEEDEDLGPYKVVINHEEQYSIWPLDRNNPSGWTDVGFSGSKAECLSHIDKVWVDMRPLSLRKWMAEHPDDAPAPAAKASAEPPARELVDYLCSTEHPARLVIRGPNPEQELESVLARPYVQILFPGTQGGTELTVKIDREKSELSGQALLFVGQLELDDRRVECRARIDRGTREGTGRLTKL